MTPKDGRRGRGKPPRGSGDPAPEPQALGGDPVDPVDPADRAEAIAEARGERGRGPLESMFQEALRRATAAGLSGFFFTEEAIRKAVSESVPPQWVSFLAEQSNDVRDDIANRMTREFGSWLRTLDVEKLLHAALDGHDFTVEIKVRAEPKGERDPSALHVVPRHK